MARENAFSGQRSAKKQWAKGRGQLQAESEKSFRSWFGAQNIGPAQVLRAKKTIERESLNCLVMLVDQEEHIDSLERLVLPLADRAKKFMSLFNLWYKIGVRIRKGITVAGIGALSRKKKGERP